MLKPWRRFDRRRPSDARTAPSSGCRLRGGATRRPPRRFRAGESTVNQYFPSWARAAERASRRRRRRRRAFCAGAGLALLDQILRLDPPRFRRRAAPAPGPARRHRLRRLARHREDVSALRDAEHLAPIGGANQPRRAPPSAVAPLRPAARRGSTRRRCEPPPIFSAFRTPPASRGSPTPCGTSRPAPKLRSRRPRAPAPRR